MGSNGLPPSRKVVVATSAPPPAKRRMVECTKHGEKERQDAEIIGLLVDAGIPASEIDSTLKSEGDE